MGPPEWTVIAYPAVSGKFALIALGGLACALERALGSHFRGNPLYRAAADADLFGGRQHALLGPQHALDPLFDLGGYAGTSELLPLLDGPF